MTRNHVIWLLVAVLALTTRPGTTGRLYAQAGAALVQPGGIEGLAKPPARPGVVDAAEAGPAQPAADQEPANGDANPAGATQASPFELRFIISYVLMMIFMGAGMFLAVRPSGRLTQGDDAASKGKANSKK